MEPIFPKHNTNILEPVKVEIHIQQPKTTVAHQELNSTRFLSHKHRKLNFNSISTMSIEHIMCDQMMQLDGRQKGKDTSTFLKQLILL